jgi:hypothetical protein
METALMKLKAWGEDNKRYSFEAGIQPDVILSKINQLIEEEELKAEESKPSNNK